MEKTQVAQTMGEPQPKSLIQTLKIQVGTLGSVGLLIWLVYGINTLLFSGHLVQFGIIPRTMVGLRGILFAPLLHGSLTHLITNTVPLLTLGWLVILRGVQEFWLTTALVMLIAGSGTWLIGAPGSVHIGASGVIFGYFGFLLLRGYFERSVTAMALSLTAGLLYGSLILGVMPGSLGISWESHLFGFIGGAIAARILPHDPSSS